MSLSRPVPPSADYDDYFPLLALPNELIAIVFASLSIKDRLRARVNKRLDKIELESKYFVDKLVIKEKPNSATIPSYWNQSISNQHIVFFKDRPYSIECIRRFAMNITIRHFKIKLTGSSNFHCEVYHLFKYCDIERMEVYFDNASLEKRIMVDSYFLSAVTGCKCLEIEDGVYITSEALHQLYKLMVGFPSKFRQFIMIIRKKQCIAFLQLVGVTYMNGQFFSDRNIELYENDEGKDEMDKVHFHIFDGNIEIVMLRDIFKLGDGYFQLILHENQESFEKSKIREDFVKMDIPSL